MTLQAWKLVAFMLVMLLGCAFVIAQTRSGGQATQLSPPQDTGRFQIVDGTPEYAMNIMLIDTWTGNSWQTCRDSNGTDGWCPLPLFNSAPGTTNRPATPPPVPDVLPGVPHSTR
jgi:hypothetical protein